MCGVPDRPRRRLPAAPDRARPPRRRLRADGGSGGGEETRRQSRSCGATWSASSRPGTITEERLLDPGRANLFVAAGAARGSPTTRWRYGLAAVDISTGRFALSETDEPGLSRGDRPARAARDPAARRDPRRSGPVRPLAGDPRAAHAAAARRPRSGIRRAAAEASISASRPSMPSARSAAPSSLPPAARSSTSRRRSSAAARSCNPPTREASGAALAIDAATRANLELTRTLSGERAGIAARRDRLHA